MRWVEMEEGIWRINVDGKNKIKRKNWSYLNNIQHFICNKTNYQSTIGKTRGKRPE